MNLDITLTPLGLEVARNEKLLNMVLPVDPPIRADGCDARYPVGTRFGEKVVTALLGVNKHGLTLLEYYDRKRGQADITTTQGAHFMVEKGAWPVPELPGCPP
jgi:hypothetical protein